MQEDLRLCASAVNACRSQWLTSPKAETSMALGKLRVLFAVLQDAAVQDAATWDKTVQLVKLHWQSVLATSMGSFRVRPRQPKESLDTAVARARFTRSALDTYKAALQRIALTSGLDS
jgi:hypothetical protein